MRLLPRLVFTVLILVSVGSLVRAGNPVFPEVYTADPSAMVHNGVVYIYTGHDEAAENDPNYRMKEWLCFSSNDMVNWRSHGPVMKLTDFSWAQSDAWAGDVVERDGKFYWYVPVYNKTIPGFSIGVAVADSPIGPFKDARGSAIITNNMTTDLTIFWDDIDPKVFIDTDGQAYLFWGNSKCRYVKLKPNMIETDGDIVTITTLPLFTEATWVHKRGNLYYLTYATEFPEKLGYATADRITGPWTYRGVFKGYAENCNTNHHAIIDFKGRSYLVYHNGALPKGGNWRRSVCIDYLDYNDDGTIRPVIETKDGVKPVPIVTLPVHDRNVSLGRPVSLAAAASGVPPFSYRWFKDNVALAATGSTLTIDSVTASDLGNYTVVASDANGSAASAETDLSVGLSGRLTNLSVRSPAGAGSDTLILGFGIAGGVGKPMLIRATGPSLTNFGVSGVLPDPRLDLYQNETPIGANDSWLAAPNLSAVVAVGGDKLGGFPVAPADAVLFQSLPAGTYSAQVSAVGGTTGVALIEAYDTDPTDPSLPSFAAQSRLINLSARTRVGTGDDVLIAGFMLNGTLPKRVMIRGTGPTLQKFGVTGVLADPDLELFRGSASIMENQSWAASDRLPEIYAAGGEKLGDNVLDPREAVLIATLSPGLYSVHVRGANATTGVALVEVYQLP